MRPMTEGSIAWATGEPPVVRGPWESAIIDLAEKGGARFRKILTDHVRAGHIRSERANKALKGQGVSDAR